MIIRHIGILAIALAALSACKAVTLQEATVTQPTFGIEAEDWSVAATDELRQDAYHAPTPTTHPTAAVINTQDLHAQLIGSNPPVTINAVFGNNQVTSIPGSIWLPAADQSGTFDDDVQTQLASALGNLTDDDLARPIVVYAHILRNEVGSGGDRPDVLELTDGSRLRDFVRQSLHRRAAEESVDVRRPMQHVRRFPGG